MTVEVPNPATLWGRSLVDELAKGGLEAVCIAPGSRSTPLTVAFAAHPEIRVYSHLDERSAAFFALGRSRRTGEPTALVCTSGTAAANFHPAVIEADQARVPLLVLTADRPAELRDSGANQTIDQVKLYGDAVRWDAELPEPEADERKLRSLRTTAARALATATGTPAGPVHLNCPFRKPLEPTPVPGSVPEAFLETDAATGRDGPFVDVHAGRTAPKKAAIERVSRALADADRPLLVAGPADPGELHNNVLEPAAALATAVDAPLLADPLSGCRFGSPVKTAPVCGGYDAYVDELSSPDVVVRWGASPTSKRLRQYLADSGARQFLLDPAGGWREATFTATDLLVAEPSMTLQRVLDATEGQHLGAAESQRGSDSQEENDGSTAWLDAFDTAERRHWTYLEEATANIDETQSPAFEGAILASVFADAPDPSTVFVSNSMPVRDADRFARPRRAALSTLANRGASGIDGITSTALGTGSAIDDPLVLVTGDLAFYHDANGLLAIERCDVDATIVMIHNDGGGIFHKLPIEAHDPPFSEQFKTPHGLEFDDLASFYGLEFERVDPRSFSEAYRRSLAAPGTQVLSVPIDAEASHRHREELGDQVRRAVGEALE